MNTKIKDYYKLVMFCGNVLHIPDRANWLAVNEGGTMSAFMEKPYISYGGWDVENGASWLLDARAELGGKDWRDTLTRCPHDQQWMIEVTAMLEAAMHVQILGSKEIAGELVSMTSARIAAAADKDDGREAVFDSFLKHAIPERLQEQDVMRELRDKIFPKPKDPDHLVVKDYYGRDIIVPPWARWLAMDEDGEATVFVDEPYKEKEGGWWRRSKYENPRIAVAWFPRHIAKSSWRDSLQEVQPEPSGE